ncbi:hypothetical protein JCM31598_38050 [Desulfonatronum parangueonense]
MTEKSLLTMREIARELNVHYKMVVNFRNQLQPLLPSRFGGQYDKYPTECVDFFRLTSVLKDEGYTFEMIRNVLSGQEEVIEDGEIKEWVMQWRAKIEVPSCYQSQPAVTSRGQPLPAVTSRDQLLPDMTSRDQLLPVVTSSNQSSPVVTGHYQDEPVMTSYDQEQPVVTSHSQDQSVEAPEPQLEQAQPFQPSPTGPDLEERIQDMLDHSLSRLESRILSEISELLPQLNSALTQFYKFSHELLTRLEKIETELGVEAPAMATEIDLEGMQVRMEPAYSHADLDFVRNSVHEGKPDREAVRQWVLSERRKGPEQSYAVLAEILNEAGVPTLSGREGWNRGTLRNLITGR